MRKKFKVGNIIVYSGSYVGCKEQGREQIILDIDDYYIYMIFLDNNCENQFGLNSGYIERCKIIGRDINYVHSNGVPLIWGSEL